MEFDDVDAVRFAERFAARRGVYARMWCDASGRAGYAPVHADLDPDVAAAHLRGDVTVGAYLVDAQDRSRHAVVDLDATRPALDAALRDRRDADALGAAMTQATRALHDALVASGLRPLVVDSGRKGRHLWCFLDEAEPAERVRSFLRSVVGGVPIDPRLRVELFPRQDRVPQGGLGNLVKLPLGIHLVSGRRAVVLDDQGAPCADGLARLLGWAMSSLPRIHVAPPPELPAAPGPDVDTLVVRCPMVRLLLEEARRDRRLGRDELLVLHHTVGHVPSGVPVLQELCDTVPDLPEAARPGAVLRGHPMSCAKIRKRLPQHALRVPCDCVFPERSGEYPHPLRHLDVERDLAGMVARLAEARRVLRELEREVAAELSGKAGNRHIVPGGAWVLGPDGVVAFVPEVA